MDGILTPIFFLIEAGEVSATFSFTFLAGDLEDVLVGFLVAEAGLFEEFAGFFMIKDLGSLDF